MDGCFAARGSPANRSLHQLSRRQFGGLAGAIVLGTAAKVEAQGKRASGRGVVRIHRPLHYRLGNGLTVVLQEDHWQPRVACVMSYAIGSGDDPDGYAQLAHLVEHLTFRGSRHVPTLDGFRLLESAGGLDANGVTSLDRTDYFCVVPSSRVALPLWIESERMAFTLEHLNSTDLALERQIVENERRLRNAGYPSFIEHIVSAAFGDAHPYAAPDDPLSDLQGIDLEAARWFFQQGYRPSNASLIVVGDFEAQSLQATLERYFSAIRNPSSHFARKRPAPLARLAARELVFEQHVYQERVAVAYRAPTPGTRERAALELGVHSMAEALAETLVEAIHLAADVRVDFHDFELGSLLVANFALMKGKKHSEILQRFDAQCEKLRESAQAAALVRTRSAFLIQRLNALQDPLKRALQHLESLRFTGLPFDLSREMNLLGSITSTEVVAALERFVWNQRRLEAKLVADKHPNLPDGGRVQVTP